MPETEDNALLPEPTEPTEPTEPMEPVTAEATQIAELEEPGQPTEPMEPVQAEEPVELDASDQSDASGSDDVPGPDVADAALVEGVSGGVSWIPFAVYLGLWVVLAGLSAFFLHAATPEQPARWMPEYEPLLWTGVGLTALGPVLSLAVWLVARARRSRTARRGLFSSVMTRGALAAFFGVLLWLGTLFVLELIASGWTL